MVPVAYAGSRVDSGDAVAYCGPLAFDRRLVRPHHLHPHHRVHPCP